MGTCNEHGVYEADEVLALPLPKKGWRGLPLADIRLADLGDHWIWATGYQLHSGDWSGASNPLTDGHSSHQAPSREAAVEAASAYLRARLAKHAAEGHADAVAIVGWLASLNPAQLDLFGEAA